MFVVYLCLRCLGLVWVESLLAYLCLVFLFWICRFTLGGVGFRVLLIKDCFMDLIVWFCCFLFD